MLRLQEPLEYKWSMLGVRLRTKYEVSRVTRGCTVVYRSDESSTHTCIFPRTFCIDPVVITRIFQSNLFTWLRDSVAPWLGGVVTPLLRDFLATRPLAPWLGVSVTPWFRCPWLSDSVVTWPPGSVTPCPRLILLRASVGTWLSDLVAPWLRDPLAPWLRGYVIPWFRSKS